MTKLPVGKNPPRIPPNVSIANMDDRSSLRERVSIQDAIDFLNELVELDRASIFTLFTNRVNCNEELANHPTVQIGALHGDFTVGILGILNGLFGVDERGWGPICSVMDGDNEDRPYYFDRTPGPVKAIVDKDLYRGKFEDGEA